MTLVTPVGNKAFFREKRRVEQYRSYHIYFLSLTNVLQNI